MKILSYARFSTEKKDQSPTKTQVSHRKSPSTGQHGWTIVEDKATALAWPAFPKIGTKLSAFGK